MIPNRTRYFQGKTLRFIPRHQMRGVHHGRYKGGVIRAKGYIWLLKHGHPRTTPRGYVKRCWLVAEQKLGRYLLDGEIVHHKDGNKLNDTPENLDVISQSEHAKLHRAQRGIDPHNGQFLPAA